MLYRLHLLQVCSNSRVVKKTYLIARTRSWNAVSTLIRCFALASRNGIFSCCARSLSSDGATYKRCKQCDLRLEYFFVLI